MGRAITGGTTNVSTVIRIVDSTDGTPETGVTSATAGLDLWYRREGAAVVSLTESDLSALTDAHSDGGMLHIGNGYYRVDIPDLAFAAGVGGVLIGGTATGMVVIGEYHPIDEPTNTTKWLGTPVAYTVSGFPDVNVYYYATVAASTGTNSNKPEVDLTHIHDSALTETSAGYLAAAFKKLFDVASPVLVASDVMRGTDSANTTVPDAAGVVATALGDGTVILHSDYNAAKTAAHAGDLMLADLTKIHGTALTETDGQLAGRFVDFFDQAGAGYSVATALSSFKATGFSTHSAADVYTAFGTGGNLTTCATATSVTVSDKTGFSVSQTGLDAVLKTTTFALAMADAIWDEAISGHTTGTTFGGKNQKAVPSETVGDYKATGFSTHSAADVYSAFGDGSNLTTCATATSTTCSDKTGFALSSTGLDLVTTWTVDITGTVSGNSQHNAAAVWAAADRALSTPADYKANVSELALEASLSDGSVMLHSDYDAAKTAAQAGDAMTLSAGAIVAASFGAGAIDATAIAAGAIDNATFAADVQSTAYGSNIIAQAVGKAVVNYGLDHLVSASVTGTDVADNSIIAKMVSKSATADWDSFANTDDALEAIRDQGDSDWVTGSGTSTLTQADIRTAVGLASADLDTQLSAISGYVDCLPVTLDGSTFTNLPKVVTDDASRTASMADVSALALEASLSDGSVTLDSAYDNAKTAMRGTDNAALATTALTNATWTDAKAGYLDASIAAIPTTAMRGTDDAALATTALSTVTWTAEKAGFLDASIAAIPTTAMRGTDNAALATTALTNVTWTDAKAAFVDASIAAIPTTAMRGTDNAALATGVALTASERNSTADAILARSVATCEESAAEWSLCTVILATLESSVSGTTWTIKRTDGTTTHATKTVTADSDADPITGVG